MEHTRDQVEVGQWYWVKDTDYNDGKEYEYEWLGCVVLIGSNFVKLLAPHAPNGGQSYIRIHRDDFYRRLRQEPNAREVIQDKITYYQQRVREHMAAVKAITARLGVSGHLAIERKTETSSQALATLSGQTDVKAYESALVRAKEQDLPALFEAIKKDSEDLSKWMTAESLPLEAMAKGLEGCLDDVRDRIFNVSLYAGLTEQVVRCADGAPAKFNERLHILQRRLYADEECLLNYRHGGMDFTNIEEFDAWLVLPENRDRILPFPRCMVAMQVRRNAKEREWDGSLKSIFIKIRLGDLDKLTFLYVRNGEQVYRLNCDLEFGELIFPDKAMFDPSEPMMVRMFGSRVDKMITTLEYEDRLRELKEREAKSKQWVREHPHKQWKAANPGKSWDSANPYRNDYSFRPSEWRPFDLTNVYYDECVNEVADRIKQYNRIALIIQGLFDRSNALHPHPPVKTWTPEGFAAAIELVYDGTAVLHHGDVPDFEAYRARCNETLKPGSLVIGQDHYWQKKEAEKESRRLDRDWRNKSEYRPKLFKPYGNPGPGYIARIASWHPVARKATFKWQRENRAGDSVSASITVPAEKLFNVSAYQPGDYKQFFQDPRTRAAYLKWAPMLIAAEEYYAGNINAESGSRRKR